MAPGSSSPAGGPARLPARSARSTRIDERDRTRSNRAMPRTTQGLMRGVSLRAGASEDGHDFEGQAALGFLDVRVAEDHVGV